MINDPSIQCTRHILTIYKQNKKNLSLKIKRENSGNIVSIHSLTITMYLNKICNQILSLLSHQQIE